MVDWLIVLGAGALLARVGQALYATGLALFLFLGTTGQTAGPSSPRSTGQPGVA